MPDHNYTATEYERRLEAERGPLVLEIDGIELETPISSNKTTIVLNNKGRILLKRLLGGMSRDEYESKSIVGRDAAWLDFLHSIL